ncbi:hypothetical protein FE783_04890 [Paenibacillus mesophilus]|uniref:YheC/YheD family protein n=1 Tax=Paenibacillus mesophilus TaxID=2582849 RepID=UPI00110EAA92|nr:YheC/YheD family protein [Paenibacillus mesophilus]TMV52280.1 hypothetical protein FE783_04890 [Paenibacillus mesophilus]
MTFSLDKLTKYKLMAKSPKLKSALPKTLSMTKRNFRSLLAAYGDVIAKPSRGSGGVGVISISSKGRRTFKVHYGTKIKTIRGLSPAYANIRRNANGASYIVQQKIALARVNGRPFDARVMVQRGKRTGWKVTGKLAKLAGAGFIITNIARSKGKVVPLSTAIRKSDIRGSSVGRIHRRMNRIARKAAKQLRSYYRIRTLGLDAGIDRKGKVWIIEANFKPAKSLFLKLKDKSMYRRIVGFHKK